MTELVQKIKTKYFYISFFLFAFLVLFLRRPETLLHPQFWGEDGAAWFANAYNLGSLKSLFLTQNGYFQTISRIAAIISLAFPIAKAPLIFNFIALMIQTLPALLIVSPRFAGLIPSFKTRLLMAMLYLFLPNTAEIHGNITNSQWFLALTAFMVVIAERNEKKIWQIFDSSILILSGLSGPFSLFLTPIAFIIWYLNKEKQAFKNLIITSSTAAIQLAGLLILDHGERLYILPDFTIKVVFSILARQVIWGSLIGINGYIWLLNNTSWYFWFFSITTFLALLLVIYAVIRSPLQLKLLILFSALIFLASLVSPTGLPPGSELKFLTRSTTGMRYWLIPMIAFITTLIWGLAKTNPLPIKIFSGLFLAAMIFGIYLDFQHPKLIDYRFESEIKIFQDLPRGEKMAIPINPYGWSMEIIKK
jgi:hypothetical protein